MQKFLIMVLAMASINCQSANTKTRMTEDAANCNAICKANPEVREYSMKGGGGSPLLFLGGFESKCGCK